MSNVLSNLIEFFVPELIIDIYLFERISFVVSSGVFASDLSPNVLKVMPVGVVDIPF